MAHAELLRQRVATLGELLADILELGQGTPLLSHVLAPGAPDVSYTKGAQLDAGVCFHALASR